MTTHATKTTVLIEDLRINAFVGHKALERKNPQVVAVDIACTLTDPHVLDDYLKNSFDYVPLIEEATRVAITHKRRLIETFAEELADICFTYPRIQTVVVSVRKPHKLPAVEAVEVARTFERNER